MAPVSAYGEKMTPAQEARAVQVARALQIEHISKTVSSPAFLTNSQIRREMDIEGCDVTARTVKTKPQTKPTTVDKITFDLSRTQIPDPSGSDFAFVATNAVGEALFVFRFAPPYEPLSWTMRSGRKIEQTVSFTYFAMSHVSDESDPHRLLELLGEYKAAYCVFLG